MATSLTGSGLVHNNGVTQTSQEGIVKIGFTSSNSVNFSAGSGFGPQWQYAGSEVAMGVPANANNWYRIRYQTICDDQGGGAQGTGAAIYRHTPSSGWVRVMDQGHHATLENDTGDLYWMDRVDYLVPVHPSFPTQAHSFRIYHANWNGPARVHCSIGGDQRRNGWNNCILEVFEIDRLAMNSGTLTRY
jgi:hypothetical protein